MRLDSEHAQPDGKFMNRVLIRADLHDTTLSHATSLRHELFRVNQTFNSFTTVAYVKKKIVVGF